MTDHHPAAPPRHATELDAELNIAMPGVERRTTTERPARDLIVVTLLAWRTGDDGMVTGPVEELADALTAALRADVAALRALLLDGF